MIKLRLQHHTHEYYPDFTMRGWKLPYGLHLSYRVTKCKSCGRKKFV